MNLHPDAFWRLTYAEFVEMAKGFARRERRKANELIYLAWHVAALERQKELPELAGILLDIEEKPKERRVMTDEEMMAICRLWNAALGGEFVEN